MNPLLLLSLTHLLRFREESRGKNYISGIKFQNLLENFTSLVLQALDYYTLQFSQNISDYSGHSISKNALWEPLASANRQMYWGGCGALLRQDYQEFDYLFYFAYFATVLTQLESTPQDPSQIASELCCSHSSLILFSNYLLLNCSAFVVWQWPMAQVISTSLLKITCFQERKGQLFNSSNHSRSGSLTFPPRCKPG